MTIVRAIFFALLVTLLSLASVAAHAASGCPSYDTAQQNCMNYIATSGGKGRCANAPDPTNGGAVRWVWFRPSDGLAQNSWGYSCPAGWTPPTNSTACQAVPQLSNYQQSGKVISSMIWCKAGVPSPTDTSVTLSCTMKFTPAGPPTQNQWGSWHTLGSLTASGDTCDGSGTGPGAWQQIGPDGSKSTPNPMPSDAPANQAAAPPPNQSCGGGSCYDAANDRYCMVSGGAQTCISGSQARGGGGCSSVGESTLCAGSPAPSPGAPPASPISDPTHEIKASDTWTQADKNTGQNQTITVNTYGSGSTSPSSGQKSGDTGPASSSTAPTPGDGTSSSGGGDCNAPPVVSGSGGMAAIAYQTWRTRCALEGDKGNPGTGASVGKLYTPSGDTSQSVVADFQSKVQDAPIAGAVTGFFAVGGVGGACPTWTLAATEWNPELTFDFYCRPEADEMLDMAKVIILITCAYVAWVIAMGDS